MVSILLAIYSLQGLRYIAPILDALRALLVTNSLPRVVSFAEMLPYLLSPLQPIVMIKYQA